MPNSIIWPAGTKKIIDEIRSAIGRDVTFNVLLSGYECPTCGLDPINNTAIDSFCPTCSGIGIIPVYSGATLSGHITWGFAEQLGWVSGGKLDEGDCRVQIEYTLANEQIVRNAKSVIVDGRLMEISRIIPRGVKALNRILIDLIEVMRN